MAMQELISEPKGIRMYGESNVKMQSAEKTGRSLTTEKNSNIPRTGQVEARLVQTGAGEELVVSLNIHERKFYLDGLLLNWLADELGLPDAPKPEYVLYASKETVTLLITELGSVIAVISIISLLNDFVNSTVFAEAPSEQTNSMNEVLLASALISIR